MRYQILVLTYTRDNKADNAFNTAEQSRAKYLAEQLAGRMKGNPLPFSGVTNYQKTLDNQSVVVSYSNSDLDNMVVIVADNRNIYAVEINAYEILQELMKKYDAQLREFWRKERDRKERLKEFFLLQQAREYRLELIVSYYRRLLGELETEGGNVGNFEFISRRLYDLLIGKIKPYIKEKRNLRIIPDGILAFLPFETLIDPGGNYLIEKHDVTYTQSLTIDELIGGRKYAGRPGAFLAFGGAVYDEEWYEVDMKQVQQNFEYIKKTTRLKVERGENLREQYQQLGLSNWDNLPQSLTMVNRIKNIIGKGTVYTGGEVEESFIKKLSKEGVLNKYNVIHFAAHGIAVPEIPELSALVLSQYRDERYGEDGYLTMNEIANLSIRADFVNLSACQTGLGKIYGGEGVVGLTQAFMLAGAKSV
jgi:CHAT domain-containing protein